MVNDLDASRDIGSLHELLAHQPPFAFPRENIPPGWLDALSNQGLTEQQRHMARSFRWYRRRFIEEEERRPGRGLHELFFAIATTTVVKPLLNVGTPVFISPLPRWSVSNAGGC